MRIIIQDKFEYIEDDNGIEVGEEDLKNIGITKCFDIENNKVIDFDNSDILENIKKQQRILEIKLWFKEYDNQVKQYERCKRLGIEFDKDIVELDNQAKAYQEELRKLDVNSQENMYKEKRL